MAGTGNWKAECGGEWPTTRCAPKIFWTALTTLENATMGEIDSCISYTSRTAHFGTVSELKPSHTLYSFVSFADVSRFAVLLDSDANASCLPCGPSSEAKTMKSKTWTVITNTGKQADLASGLEKKEVQRPTHISAREFVHWLAPESHVDDDTLRSLFRL
jgi:hypothetical protein